MAPWRELLNRSVLRVDSRRDHGVAAQQALVDLSGRFSRSIEEEDHTVHENTTASSTNLTITGNEEKEKFSARRIIFKRNAQQLILQALRKNDLSTFKTLLNENVDLNMKYENETTLLSLACASAHDEKAEFVELLLKAGADPNNRDEDKKTSLHHAAIMGNEKIMQLLLQNSSISVDVNAMSECGNTALHDATAPYWEFARIDSLKRCIRILMEHERTQFNLPNYFGNTPLWLALEQNPPHDRELLQVLLVCGGDRIDVNIFHMRSGDTIRERIEKEFPTLIPFLPKDRENMPFVDPLMEMILSPNPNLDDFKELINRDNFNVNKRFGNPYYCTCLELACRRKDLAEGFLTALIEKGADIEVLPDKEYPQKIYCSALHQATSITNHKALRVLLNSFNQETLNIQNYFGQTALHIAAQKRGNPQDECEIQKCVHLLVGLTDKVTETDTAQSVSDLFNEHSERGHIGVDIKDECKGDTALHQAAYYANNSTVLALLDSGADIMLENDEGTRPLDLIDVDTLKKFLDNHIDANFEEISSKDFEAVIRYTPLYYQSSKYEMYVIDHISRSSEHRELLQHPFILSFVNLKWHLLRWLFYTQLAIFVFFTVCFTAYIFLANSGCMCINDENIEELKFENNGSKNDASNDCTHAVQFIGFNVTFGKESSNGLRITCILPLIILALLELTQCMTDRSRYFKDLENIFEICTFTLCAIILCKVWKCENFQFHMSGIAILLTWIELVLISGRMPTFSLQLAMLKKVTVTFFRFMVWYSLLIVAFALSFYIVFGGTENKGHKSTHNFFEHPDSSILKTIIMMVGDLSVSFDMLGKVQGTSHLIFLIFIFLIIIILLNLLNGLAVSDTQAIQNDSKTLSLVSRVKLIVYLEMMLVAMGTRFWGDFFKERIEPMFRVFEPNRREKMIIIQIHNRKIIFYPFQRDDSRFRELLVDCEVVSNLKRLYVENQSSDIADVKQLLLKIQNKIDVLEKAQIINERRKSSIK